MAFKRLVGNDDINYLINHNGCWLLRVKNL